MTKTNYVLFIDDDENVLKSLMRSMQRWLSANEMKALFANTVVDAVNIFKDHKNEIKTIVTDQQMPVLKGNELAKVLKKNSPDLPVIILSGHSSMEDMQDIINTGVFAYRAKPWDNKDLQNEITNAVNYYSIVQENIQMKNELLSDLQVASNLQKTIMNAENPLKDRCSVNVTFMPNSQSGISGDYYDIIKLSENKMLILSGDVSGHGVQSSFLTAALKSIIYPDYIRTNSIDDITPSSLISWLNKRITEFLDGFDYMFLTFSAVLLDFKKMTITTANAGQPPVYLIRDNSIKSIKHDGLALGINPDEIYAEVTEKIYKDDILVLCTDGIFPSGSDSENFTEINFKDIFLNKRFSVHNHKEIISDIEKQMFPSVINDDYTLLTTIIL